MPAKSAFNDRHARGSGGDEVEGDGREKKRDAVLIGVSPACSAPSTRHDRAQAHLQEGLLVACGRWAALRAVCLCYDLSGGSTFVCAGSNQRKLVDG